MSQIIRAAYVAMHGTAQIYTQCVWLYIFDNREVCAGKSP